MEPVSPTGTRLHVGRSTTLVQALRDELRYCAAASFAVAFVMESGLDILEGDLRAAAPRGASIRFLTGDYLGVTEPTALRRLASIGAMAQVRCYEVGRGNFHPKAYLFDHTDGSGRAFIGSANLSRSGLVAGIEWTWTAVQDFTAGRVAILFVVDLFNEGVDIPCVDLPTESMTASCNSWAGVCVSTRARRG